MRRHPEPGVLQRVVREHLETFHAEARARAGGAILAHLGLPIDPPDPTPARAPDWLPGRRAGCDDTAGPSAD